jgi:hypothetical protein
MNRRNLHRRLDRLEARWYRARWSPGKLSFVNSGHPEDAATMIGPDGQLVWWRPPEGCKMGEPLEPPHALETRRTRGEVPGGCRIIFGDPMRGPTTVVAPDGRLLWLKPPEGYKEGEAVDERGPESNFSLQ